MKKLFYLILLCGIVFIPKNVFAENYSVSFVHMWGFSGTNTYTINTPGSYTNNGIEYWNYDSDNIQDIDKYEFNTGTTSYSFDTSITYTVTGYFGFNMYENLQTQGVDPLSFFGFYVKNGENGTYVDYTCDTYLMYKSSPRYYYKFSCNDVSFPKDTIFSIVTEVGNNKHGYNAYISKQFDFVRNDTNAKFDEMINEQQKTNDKLDEANETSKGIWGTIKEVLSNIISLPMKLIELLIDALKSLFVPTDDQLYEIINDSKDLAENFGFVGETINFFINIFTSLLGMVNANGCIELPEFTIGKTSLFDSFTFWQAQNVCLNDNVILSSNINTIRTITSIVLVGLFINFASKQFFNILSKNERQNDEAQEILDRYK